MCVLVNGTEVVRDNAAEFACYLKWDSDGNDLPGAEMPGAVLVWWKREREDTQQHMALNAGDQVSVQFVDRQ